MELVVKGFLKEIWILVNATMGETYGYGQTGRVDALYKRFAFFTYKDAVSYKEKANGGHLLTPLKLEIKETREIYD